MLSFSELNRRSLQEIESRNFSRFNFSFAFQPLERALATGFHPELNKHHANTFPTKKKQTKKHDAANTCIRRCFSTKRRCPPLFCYQLPGIFFFFRPSTQFCGRKISVKDWQQLSRTAVAGLFRKLHFRTSCSKVGAPTSNSVPKTLAQEISGSSDRANDSLVESYSKV